MLVNSGVVHPYSAQIGRGTGRPHWPACGAGGAAACADAGHAAISTNNARNLFTTPTLDTRERRGQTPGHVPVSDPSRLLVVERRVDFGDLFGLDVRAGLGTVAVRDVVAEVEAEAGEALAAVGVDLLERREQLLLGLRARVRARRHLVGRADLDVAIPLQPRGRRDELPDDHVLLQAA